MATTKKTARTARKSTTRAARAARTPRNVVVDVPVSQNMLDQLVGAVAMLHSGVHETIAKHLVGNHEEVGYALHEFAHAARELHTTLATMARTKRD